MKVDWVGGQSKHSSIQVDAQECVNMYVEYTGPGAKSNPVLVGTPGLKLFATLTNSGSVRGMYTASTGTLYVVYGNTFSSVTVDGTETIIGTLLTTTGPVQMTDNGVNVLIVDGTYGYTYTFATAVLARITDANYPGGTHGLFTNGYYLVNKPSTGRFYFSASYGGAVWGALDYYTAEGMPDNVLAMAQTNNEIYLIGSQSTEVWYYTGDASPFQRIHGAFNNIGTAAKYSVASDGDTVYFLGGNNAGQSIVWAMQGYTPQRISTHAIENEIAAIARIDDAFGYCYQQEGHSFYVLTFQTGDKTFVYDLTTGLWHKRTTYNSDTGLENRHRATCHAFYNQKNYVGDNTEAKIWEYDMSTYTDNSGTIVRSRTAGCIHNDRKRMYFGSFEIDMQKGVGLTTGQGSDPQAMLQYSDDAGMTWSNERWATIGAIGKYETRVKWNRLGASRDRVFKLTISDPVKCTIISAHIEVEAE